jgi:hypothetical protein
LTDGQLLCLRNIPPSYALKDGFPVYPVGAVLQSGETIRHVYVSGLDAAKKSREYLIFRGPLLDSSTVQVFRESEDRIPFHFANLLYEIGENHMGGLTFQLTFSDGKVADYGFGSGLFRDFLKMPPAYRPQDILELDFLSRKKGDFPGNLGVQEDYSFCFIPDSQLPHPPEVRSSESEQWIRRATELEQTIWR